MSSCAAGADSFLIFASESYGGHYVPAWVDATLNSNAAPDVAHEDVLPLRAIYLGNALVNRSVQQSHHSWSTFCHAEGIISPSVTSESIDKTDVVAHLGYEPNMYDFRLESQDGCGAYGYDYSRWASTLYSEPFRRALHVCGKAGADSFAGCTGGCHVCIGNPPCSHSTSRTSLSTAPRSRERSKRASGSLLCTARTTSRYPMWEVIA